MPGHPPLIDLAAARALFAPLDDGRHERVAVAYLDPERSILGMRHIMGGVTRTAVPIRQIARDALAFDACALVMAHSHPSGDPRPSDRDVAFTIALARSLKAIGVDVIDHLVIAGDRVTSLRERGVL